MIAELAVGTLVACAAAVVSLSSTVRRCRASSRSLERWKAESAAALDRMEEAYRAIVETAGRRRHATRQISQGYLVLLSSHFQRFCRDLHSEAAAHLLRSADPKLHPIMYGALITGRKLDQGNPNPGNLGADFGRLGMSFWPDVKALHVRNERRVVLLESMARWRNAIAHQDFVSQAQALGHRTEVTLSEVRTFRRACNELARSFDRAVGTFIRTMVGPRGGW